MRMEQALPPGVVWPKDRAVTTDDGARIAYTLLGPESGPVVALCSGFLCPDTWWTALAPALAEAGHRVLLFHYRGVAASSLPGGASHARDLTREAFSIPRFAADLGAIVQAEGIETLTVVGHSMGCQVALEAYRQMPERVQAIVSVTGPYASPVRTLYGLSPLGVLLYTGMNAAFWLSPPPLLRLAWRTAWRRAPLPRLAKRLGVLAPRCPDEALATFTAHGAATDPYVAAHTTSGMHAHSAGDLLGEIAVPVLVIVGGRDPFSPPELGQHMAEAIPRATLRAHPLASHGALLEYPEQVNGWILDFLATIDGR